MLRRLLLIGLVGCLLTPRAAEAQAPEISPTLAQYLRLVDFSISGGRIHLTSRYAGRRIGSTTTNPGEGLREEIVVDISDGRPLIDYTKESKEGELRIQIRSGETALFRRSFKGPAPFRVVHLIQHREPRLVLSLTSEEGERLIETASLWHLLLAEPELCRAHVAPLVQMVNSSWDLMDQAGDIEIALLHVARTGQSEDQQAWRGLVEQLGSPKFATRRQAEQALHTAGQRAAGYLETLDLEKLDAEQRSRIRRLLNGLEAERGGETPQRIARRLASDPTVWLSLLTREDVSTRTIAAEQLALRLNRKLEFDPAGDEATRAAQLVKLRAALAP